MKEEFYERLQTEAKRRLGNSQDRDDIVNEAWIIGMRRGQLDGRPWDLLRDARRIVTGSRKKHSPGTHESLDCMPEGESCPSERFAVVTDPVLVIDILRGLEDAQGPLIPAERRKLATKLRARGYSFGQIAELLGVGKTTIQRDMRHTSN